MSNMVDKVFNTDFEEDYKLFAVGFAVLIIGLLVSFWIAISYSEFPALIFGVLIFGMLIIYGFELNLQKKTKIITAFFLGKVPNFLVAIALGAIVGWLIGALPFTILGTPSSLSTVGEVGNVPLAVIPSLSFVYIVVLAPLAETVFFRGWLYPQFTKIFGLFFPFPQFISLVFVSSAFAIFHYIVYDADVGLMFGAFIFSLIAGFASTILKSLGFEFSSHGTINFLQVEV